MLCDPIDLSSIDRDSCGHVIRSFRLCVHYQYLQTWHRRSYMVELECHGIGTGLAMVPGGGVEDEDEDRIGGRTWM